MGAAPQHDGLAQINHSRWWVIEDLTAPMAIHFVKDHFLIADPHIANCSLAYIIVESKANLKCENIIAE